jgi:hypothetical protein
MIRHQLHRRHNNVNAAVGCQQIRYERTQLHQGA